METPSHGSFQSSTVDGAFGPAVLDQDLFEVALKFRVKRRQPRQVFLHSFDHRPVGAKPGTAASERLLFPRGSTTSDGQHQRQVVLHGPVHVRVANRVVAAFGARAFDAEPLEHVEHYRRHFMRPPQVHGIGRQPDPARFRRGDSDTGAGKSASPVAQIEDERITAEDLSNLRFDCDGAAPCGQVHVQSAGTGVGDFEDDGFPPIARFALGPILNHVHLQRPLVGLSRLEKEGEGGFLPRPERVSAQAAFGLLHRPALGRDAKSLAKVLHIGTSGHLGLQGQRAGHGQPQHSREESPCGQAAKPLDASVVFHKIHSGLRCLRLFGRRRAGKLRFGVMPTA